MDFDISKFSGILMLQKCCLGFLCNSEVFRILFLLWDLGLSRTQTVRDLLYSLK